MRLTTNLCILILFVLVGFMPMTAALAADQQPETIILITTDTQAGDASALETLDWLVFHSETVHFGLNSYRLTEEACKKLLRKVRWIEKQDKEFQIVIVGHCDQRGSDSYNMHLGTLRAKEVKRYLVGYGVPQERIKTESAGYRQPLMDGEGELVWAVNRRAEVMKP